MAPVLVSLYGISRTKEIIMLVVCKLCSMPYENFTLRPGSTVAPTSSPKQCLKLLEFSKQLSDVFTQIQ